MKNRPIMLVEDNADDLELALIALRESGIKGDALVARDGQEAIDMLFGSARPGQQDYPGIVLLDIKLPRVNGFEVLKRLREEEATRYLPVVVMSSSREERDLEESYRLGANSYIQKSLDFAKFLDSVRQVGHYWLDLNEVPEMNGLH